MKNKLLLIIFSISLAAFNINCLNSEKEPVSNNDITGGGSVCGNNITEVGETCDDGNTVTEVCTYGSTSCTVCDSTCNSIAGATSYCGDSFHDAAASEQCDDGNTVTEVCAYGSTGCTVCDSTCNSIAGATSYCGDSFHDAAASEQCDDGNYFGNDGCSVDCLAENSINPDGVRFSGNLTAGGKVLFVLPVQVGETYNIYWNDSYQGDGTQTADLKVTAKSGDNTITYFSNIDSAYTTPQIITPASGGFINLIVEGYFTTSAGSFEIWVLGENKTQTITAVNPVIVEDTLNAGTIHNYIINNLVPNAVYVLSWNDVYDGDGTKTADIKITAKNADDTTIYLTGVDSGYTNPHIIQTDSSTIMNITIEGLSSLVTGTYSFRLETFCGNNIVEPLYYETCDDGNNIDLDGCRANCADNVCGDGVIEGEEICDDGALNNNAVPDACRTTCVPAGCGDMVVDFSEECDEGGMQNANCEADCKLPVCGDGVSNALAGEECEDGNSIRNDGCSVECLVENSILPNGIRVSGNLTAGGKVLFVLPVQPGETYGVSWNDNFYGDQTQSAYALKVSAYNEDKSTTYFTQAYGYYNYPIVFTNDSGSFVNIEVEGYFASTEGDFEIWAWAANSTNIISSGTSETVENYLLDGGAHNFTFENLIPNGVYVLSWNDSFDGDGTKTADVKVTAKNGDNTTIYISAVDSGYTAPKIIQTDDTGIMNVTVEGYSSFSGGTYSLSLQTFCGNNIVESQYLESCDDGNNVDLDGCSSVCNIEGTLDLAANNTTINVGMAEQFTSFFTDYLSNVTDVTDSVTYHVSDESIGYFSQNYESKGMFIPLRAGSVDVYAVYGNNMTSNIISLTVTYPSTSGNLIISEISSADYGWIEIYNNGAEPANLGLYQLRAQSWNVDLWTFVPEQTYVLPDFTIAPGNYIRLFSNSGNNGLQNAYVGENAQSEKPFLADSMGFVELIKGGVTQDFLRWGTNTVTPITASEWLSAGAATALPDSYTSLARDGSLTDTNLSGDWSILIYQTPNGPNDVTCATDADLDGIPDCSELPGTTFAGLPLYDWGARQNQPDIFLEIDYMKSNIEGELIRPIRESIDAVVDTFAARGIVAHFDIGDVFDQAAGIDPADHDLGGGTEVPYAQHLDISYYSPDIASLDEYKKLYFDMRRLPVFHYIVFGDDSPPDDSFGGLGEINGNDFIVTYGHHTLHVDNWAMYGWHGGVLLHELGHNLGLRHGGDDSINDKPNYLSTMNYLYNGPITYIGSPDEGYIYIRSYFDYGSPCYLSYDSSLSNGYILDYSDGLMPPLDENNLFESNGISGMGFWVDFNCNGIVDDGIAYDLNPYSDPTLNILTDHDDWANLDLNFADGWSGLEGPLYLGDRQKVVYETPAEERRNSFIKRGKLKDRHSKRFPKKEKREKNKE
ncbi:MAG: DUF4215 domain-containing protein [Spirochaetia bacterium]|nr:DUF4215 domain-containing protein [Spirochaetia bacterium]